MRLWFRHLCSSKYIFPVSIHENKIFVHAVCTLFGWELNCVQHFKDWGFGAFQYFTFIYFNPFFASSLFLYPWKHQRPEVFRCKQTVAWNGLKHKNKLRPPEKLLISSRIFKAKVETLYRNIRKKDSSSPKWVKNN